MGRHRGQLAIYLRQRALQGREKRIYLLQGQQRHFLRLVCCGDVAQTFTQTLSDMRREARKNYKIKYNCSGIDSGSFFFLPAAAFWLSWAFSFCVGVRIYSAELFGRCTAFLAALRWCFSFGVAVCVLLFVLVCSVMPLKLSVLRFVGVGGILYRVIFSVACRRFILALNGIPIFCHFLPLYLPFFTIS